MTIHAFTEPRSPLPAYINVSERVSDPRDVIVTVRSSGENETSTIILSRDQLRKLVEDIGEFLDPAAVRATPSKGLELPDDDPISIHLRGLGLKPEGST
jgi:hypothetical protein